MLQPKIIAIANQKGGKTRISKIETQPKTQTLKKKNQNSKHKTQNSKLKTRNSKPKTQKLKKHKIQNTKLKTQNSKLEAQKLKKPKNQRCREPMQPASHPNQPASQSFGNLVYVTFGAPCIPKPLYT